jgi:hypothetical protein
VELVEGLSKELKVELRYVGWNLWSWEESHGVSSLQALNAQNRLYFRMQI